MISTLYMEGGMFKEKLVLSECWMTLETLKGFTDTHL